MSESTMKTKIREAMKSIAQRRAGKKRLVFDRTTKTIWEVARDGTRTDTGISAGDADEI